MSESLDTEAQRFLSDFATWSGFGATPDGGLHRLAGSRTHAQARQWLAERLTEWGAHTSFDRIGNLFGRFEWVPGAPYVLVGSHSDSQPNGGRFDGALGVLAAAHAATRIDRAVRTGTTAPRFNLAVVDWFNEEGARFTPSVMGSGCFTGGLDTDRLLATADLDGVTVAAALTATGMRGDDAGPPAVAYAELHIEQGRELDDSGDRIGAVTANWAVRKCTVVVHGEQSHTGATSMADRRDALVGAAHVVLAVRDVANSFPADEVLSAVGRIHVEPGSPVVVPSRVTLNVDLRAHSAARLDEAYTQLVAAFNAITATGENTVEIADCALRETEPFWPAGVRIAHKAAADAGFPVRDLMTRAGHDAVALNRVVPTILAFVPSVNGVSHSAHEFTRDCDLLAGVDVLTSIAEQLVTSLPHPSEPRSAI
ncbi:M20 family metallo-hydrolase [Tsukamurella sputi]|uniref:M20 family metallo-hydrolase n=1 Tax=Tsukamurella sputi TaxID=2591848 RepID=A0A5C5RQW6_9ACTN|nr:M20 family metallo-hydrolase [Tsukamurella sputi]TWS25044.1 M20 family metallo-hydrolase [Tsukamurella sputi]